MSKHVFVQPGQSRERESRGSCWFNQQQQQRAVHIHIVQLVWNWHNLYVNWLADSRSRVFLSLPTVAFFFQHIFCGRMYKQWSSCRHTRAARSTRKKKPVCAYESERLVTNACCLLLRTVYTHNWCVFINIHCMLTSCVSPAAAAAGQSLDYYKSLLSSSLEASLSLKTCNFFVCADHNCLHVYVCFFDIKSFVFRCHHHHLLLSKQTVKFSRKTRKRFVNIEQKLRNFVYMLEQTNTTRKKKTRYTSRWRLSSRADLHINNNPFFVAVCAIIGQRS